ncbi:MAG TPA: hypothetical protein VGN11_12200 [Candidatus Baltobacteraceae bacterium]|jgi:hypothetical protein|nr:hypothetical protein [Candidatus Baltobacteraceae bacterium]
MKFVVASLAVFVAACTIALPGQNRAMAAGKGFDDSMPRAQQIKLAMTAAPPDVSGRATIYVLGPHGFEKAREGTNGVSCLIDRSFEGAVSMSIEPKCFDPEGTRAFLPISLRTEQLRAMGKTEAEVNADILRGYKDGRFHAPSKPGLIYMLSKVNVVPMNPQNTRFAHVPGHLMFYAPYMKREDLGYTSTSSKMVPYLADPGTPYAMMIVIPK